MAMATVSTKNAVGTVVTFPVHLDAASNNISVSSRDTSIATYSSSAVMAAADIDATPLDIAVLTGSATKTVRVKSVIVRGYWDTGSTALAIPVYFKKHTVANTGGTATATGITKFDSGDSAATAVVSQYSADPTIDATATTIAAMPLAATLETVGVGEVRIDFANTAEHGLVLRGVAQQLAINLNAWAGTQTGVNLAYTFIWSEESES